ncbi:site-specific recombinase DNA invertase Pin [Mycobacterium conspicuum]|uniref:Site-specific recombinase DNA invertase Pin n=1 Tax=Mycobacterium conspicuum TaxID=44010 RepID=A0A7I7YCN2_9MYCO|nr:site-specific recombinase DNA invertase Pin [Mycobacterium conspicuum]
MQRQLDDCLALAGRLGWEIAARFDDNDLSAFSGKRRPGFEAMLTAMRNREFGALLVWHTDRLYRSMRDLERLIDIAESNRVQIRTVQGGDLDLSTSAGRMVARILGSVARQESEHTSERRKRANQQKAAAGKWVSANRCFGYTQDGTLLEPEASMVRQAVADALAGKSMRQIAREWNATGMTGSRGHKFTGTNVRRLLINPRYAAINVHNGIEVGQGDWEPIIDVDTHKGLVAFVSDPSRTVCTSFEKKYIGSGLYVCGLCGARMRHTTPGGKQPGGRRYECSEKQCVVRIGEPLDLYVEAIVLEWFSQPKARKRLSARLNGRGGVDVTQLQAKRDALRARMDELARMFTAGDIDGSQLRSGTAEFKAQIAGIDDVLGRMSRKSPAAGMLAADDPVAYWQGCSADICGKIIDDVMTVKVLKGPRGRWFNNRDNPTDAEWERFGKYVDVKPKKVAK